MCEPHRQYVQNIQQIISIAFIKIQTDRNGDTHIQSMPNIVKDALKRIFTGVTICFSPIIDRLCAVNCDLNML